MAPGSSSTSSLKNQIIGNLRDVLTCIKYEVLQGKTVDEAYKTFSTALGGIEYREFDFWFHRFRNGYPDERVTTEFSDLPEELVMKIVDDLKWKEKSSFRKVCRSIRFIVDSSAHFYKHVSLTVADTIQMSFDDQTVAYENWEPALEDLAVVLKLPKLKIENLWIDLDLTMENRKAVVRSLKNGFESNQIHVKNLSITTEYQKAVLAVLPYLKNLESIEIDNDNPILTDKMCLLEQWQQAKTLKIGRVEGAISNIGHFNRITVTLENVLIGNFYELKEAFTSSQTLEYLCVNFDNFFRFHHLQTAISPSRTPIPDTNLILVIEYERDGIVFRKFHQSNYI
uniref:F-box domain-containing protein n=1 Tax=Caenorhabditis tropicalis TaxID=1561998 RepID=A0A1I7UPA7_9PELO